MSERDAERSVSQTVRAQLALRDMILSGRLRPGERISELQAVDITGVSRTPVRLALVRLEDEGLLQAIPSGGFMVKAFTERDILDSIELRGTLEGLAARFAAERGVSARSLEPLKECLADLDQLVRQDPISVEAFSAYVTMNARFHALLNELSASAPLIREIDRVSALPFASPSAFVMMRVMSRTLLSGGDTPYRSTMARRRAFSSMPGASSGPAKRSRATGCIGTSS